MIHPVHAGRVVLLHGIFRTRYSMSSLARYLTKNGYTVLNLGYPSTRHPLEEIVETLHDRIEGFNKPDEPLHFVGYSMGGLIIRAYLAKYRPANLGRVVMLATPNKGSEVADYLTRSSWLNNIFHMLYGPAGQQLITDQSDFAKIFGDVDYELGIVAGNRPLDPIGSHIIGKENDGKVSVESTRLDGMKDHVIVPCNHTLFPNNRQVWQHALDFLNHGKFAANRNIPEE